MWHCQLIFYCTLMSLSSLKAGLFSSAQSDQLIGHCRATSSCISPKVDSAQLSSAGTQPFIRLTRRSQNRLPTSKWMGNVALSPDLVCTRPQWPQAWITKIVLLHVQLHEKLHVHILAWQLLTVYFDLEMHWGGQVCTQTQVSARSELTSILFVRVSEWPKVDMKAKCRRKLCYSQYLSAGEAGCSPCCAQWVHRCSPWRGAKGFFL